MKDFDAAGYRFGGYLLEAKERRLLGDGGAIPLQPRAFDALLYLIEHAGHLVTKEELMGRLWPDVVVEESNLAKNIWLIRRALAENEGEASFIETVPRAGYRFVAPVERLSPSDLEMAGATPLPPLAESEIAGAPPELAQPSDAGLDPKPARLKAWAPVLGAAVLALGALATFLLWARHDAVAPTASGATVVPGARRTAVAVLGFSNLSRQANAGWLSTALAEMLSADLAAGEKLRLVPGADAARLDRSLPPEPGALNRAALSAARDQLDADFVVKGSYLTLPGPDGELLRVDLMLQNTASGDTVLTVSRTGAIHRLFAVVDEEAAALRSRLGIEVPAAPVTVAAAASMPSRPEATRLYAEGLAKLRVYDALGARPLLEAAITADPRFPLARLALSRIFATLGYDQRAIDEAQAASKLSGHLPREQQLAIAAELAEAKKDWPAAERGYRALFEFFPDNVEYGLDLVRILVAAGKAREALLVVSVLRRVVSPTDPDPRLDLIEASASGALSDWKGQLAAAQRAGDIARSRGLPLLLGEALGEQASAHTSLGENQPAEAALRDAARIFAQQGNVSAEAYALIAIANDRAGAGDADGAMAGYRQALATFERIGNRKGATHALQDIANLNWLRGDVDAAQGAARRALALSREINDRKGIVWALGGIGNTLADQGEIAAAFALQSEALTISRDIGDRSYTAFCLGALGDTHFAAGQLIEAAERYSEAANLCRELHDPTGVARHQDDLGGVALLRGRLGDAERFYAAAYEGHQRMGDREAATEVRLNLAQLRHEQGRDAESLALARQAAKELLASHESGNEVIALATAALAEMRLHQNAAAAKDCARARAALKGNRQNQPTFVLLLAEARVKAADGAIGPARALAETARGKAEHAHALATVFDARLVLGEIAQREAQATGKQALDALSRDAEAKGFVLVARKARDLVTGRLAVASYP